MPKLDYDGPNPILALLLCRLEWLMHLLSQNFECGRRMNFVPCLSPAATADVWLCSTKTFSFSFRHTWFSYTIHRPTSPSAPPVAKKRPSGEAVMTAVPFWWASKVSNGDRGFGSPPSKVEGIPFSGSAGNTYTKKNITGTSPRRGARKRGGIVYSPTNSKAARQLSE